MIENKKKSSFNKIVRNKLWDENTQSTHNKLLSTTKTCKSFCTKNIGKRILNNERTHLRCVTTVR